MKFIHAADIHLGAEPDKGMPWSRERKNEIHKSFARLVEVADDLSVDYLLLSGDIFHNPPSVQDLRQMDYILGKMRATKTIIIAGNHDHITEGSPWLTYEFQSDTYILSGKQTEYLYFKETNTYVYGFSYWSREIPEERYQSVKPEEREGTHILLAHGGDKTHIPIDYEGLKWSGFDYVAMGHIHKPQILFEDLMAYAGSLEPLDHTETGEHGYLFGEFTEEKRIVSFVPFSKTAYVTAEVVLYDTMSLEEIYDTIRTELSRMGHDNIYQLSLTGSVDPNLELDQQELKLQLEDMRIREIDIQELTYGDYESVYQENKDNVIGLVMDKLKDDPKALSYAMKALLSTTES